MLLITVLCVNFLGDGLRDAFDPQSRSTDVTDDDLPTVDPDDADARDVERADAPVLVGARPHASSSRPTTASCTRSTT